VTGIESRGGSGNAGLGRDSHGCSCHCFFGLFSWVRQALPRAEGGYQTQPITLSEIRLCRFWALLPASNLELRPAGIAGTSGGKPKRGRVSSVRPTKRTAART